MVGIAAAGGAGGLVETMKAAVFEGIETIVVRESADPRADEGSIVVRVEACGLCGSDIRNFHGGLRGGITRQVMGHEIAGTVEQVGAGVQRYAVGDRVAIAPDVSCGTCYYCRRGWVNLCVDHRMIGTHWPGGFAQYLHLPAVVLLHGMVHHMPAGLSLDHAALSEPASSVLAAQENAGIGLGDTVLVIGDGPVGCLHLEVARARGAARVIIVGLSRLAQLVPFGPDEVIDAAKQDPVAEVKRLTDGLGADVAIVATPVAATQAQAVEAVRKRGRVIFFGGLPKTNPLTTVNGNLIHYNELHVVGAFSYPAWIHQKALEVIASGKIHAERYFNRVVGLDGIVDGIREAESGRALKVLVKPWT
jgi:L-iditol 2-dehydrogenase